MGWESPDGGCVAPFVKSAQRENLRDLEGHEAVFMRNRHTIGENLPAGKQASAKNCILFMWILYSGIQLRARVPADDPTFLLGTNQGCKIPRFSSGIFGKVFVIMQPWGQFTITVRHHLSTVPLAA